MVIKLINYKEKNIKLKNEYDDFATDLPFWYLDALFSGALDNSPYRKKAIASLDLNPKSIVLDIACGMGPNFKIIEHYLQNKGKLVGLDLSLKLLERAAGKIKKFKWKNVKLVNMSITEYEPTFKFDAIICAFAMEIIPDYKKTVDKIYELLKPKGKFAMVGMKLSNKYPLKILNSIFDNIYTKYDIHIHRDFISLFKSKSMKIEYYEEVHHGFEYILSVTK